MAEIHSSRELTFRVFVLSIVLTIVLAISNAYLALKIGILTSASIPAAVISMGILRFFKKPSIYENNLVQTAASAGEAVAGGIVYTAPALVIIHYWHQFSYFENFMLAFIGGVLGVLFSIPIRRTLVTDRSLPFPEGKAIAEVLKVQQQKKIGLHFLFWGGALGALLELLQTGLKVIASSWQFWLVKSRMIIGFGVGFSATMIGAGYLIGFTTGVSIFIGAILGWFLSVPAISYFYNMMPITDISTTQFVAQLWWQKISYIGISAMLFAGIVTLLNLVKPLIRSFKLSKLLHPTYSSVHVPKYEKDMPRYIVLPLIVIMLCIATWFLKNNLPIEALGFKAYLPQFLLACILYLLVIGFIFSAITGYFSGLVGVTASPGSAIVIAGLLIAALVLNLVMHLMSLSQSNVLEAQAVVIFLVAILTGIAAIANDNIQDLKVGHLIEATPWKQQLMLLIGVVISASVIPPIMQILFNTYGIADVMPHAGMDPTQTLPAPPAALMATIVKGVFNAQLPWPMIVIGAFIVFISVVINVFLQKFNKRISILGIAIGIYLPLASSIPIFIGSLIEYFLRRHKIVNFEKRHIGVLVACGLIAGSVLMDVMLAVPFSIAGNPDALNVMPQQFSNIAVILGFLSTLLLGLWFYRVVSRFEQKS